MTCTGVSQDVEITVRAAPSELAGTESAVQLSYASTGESIGRFDFGTSDWGDGTFRTLIPVRDLDDKSAGEVYFSGSYTPMGEPQVTRDQFKAGNVRVVEERAVTPLAISNVTLTYEDNDTTPGDVTFGDLTYADRPEANASGLVVADGGAWQGEFRLQISDEHADPVGASATLERGRPYHATEGENRTRTQFQVTPYYFTLVVEGPGAPAELECTLFQVREKKHMSNQLG